jgi:hypothetical protein
MPSRPDPLPRRDGRCVVCRKKRHPPAKNYAANEYITDPFCSTQCCRLYHGTPIPKSSPGKLVT